MDGVCHIYGHISALCGRLSRCTHLHNTNKHAVKKLFFFLPPKQVGKLQQRLIKPDTLELTDQCKEETGLSVDELCKADPLDTVLQQVNSISN